MSTIYDLKKRAKELSAKNEVNSVSPVEVGNLIDDTLNLIDEYNKNVVGLGIRKIYSSITSMQADRISPVGNDGKPIRFGQLVSVYDINNPESEENGGVYAFQNPGWKLATTTAVNVVSSFGESEVEAISQKFFTEQIKNKIFTNLGIVDETLSDGFSDVTTPGYYTYQKGYNEGEVVNGILIVSNVSYPGAIARTQVKQELGKTYIRSFDIDERIWSEWEEIGSDKKVIEESDINNTALVPDLYKVKTESGNGIGYFHLIVGLSTGGQITQTKIDGNIFYRRYTEEDGWSEWDNTIVSREVFTENLTVKLNSGKGFGKYVNGDVIHCKGMTAIEVIQMALDETTVLKFNSFLMDISPEQNTGAVISGNKEIRFFLNDQSLARANSLSIIDITANRILASGLPVTSPVTVDIGTVTAGAGQKRQWKATVIEGSTGKTIGSTIYTVTWKAPIIYLYYGEVDAVPESAIVVESGNKIISTDKQFQISAENKVGNFIAFPASMSLKSIENASFSGDWWYNVSTGDDYYNSKQTMTIAGITYNVWCMIRPLPMGVKANVVFN
nr:MAG TPA: hypothetical protein [Caudoviricetes sp.]